jgi:peptidyl-prolyl cis-trans isomerase D
VGDVSEPIVVENQNIVAVLEKIIKEGTPDVETARKSVEPEIKKQKIAAEIIKKMGTTLESAAAAYPDLSVKTIGADSTLTFDAPSVPGLGNEPKVQGAAFNKDNLNKVSKPIIGNFAVYVLKVNAVSPKTPLPADQAAQRNVGRAQLMGQQYQGWFQSLQKMAVIKDNRNKVNN